LEITLVKSKFRYTLRAKPAGRFRSSIIRENLFCKRSMHHFYKNLVPVVGILPHILIKD
jgi:hypothetical protein